MKTQVNANNRCDRCGAQAYIHVLLQSDGILLFCSHHGKAVESVLRPQAKEWIDNSSALKPVPAPVPA